MATALDPLRFSEILNAEVKALADREQVFIPVVEGELGLEIGKQSGASIERWRTRRVIPAKYEDVEKLALALRKRGGLQGGLYKEFLIVGGHPNPNQVLRPANVDRPERAEHFAGRESEISELLSTVQLGRVVTLCGPGGVGKSALVAEIIDRLAFNNNYSESFPDGIMYYNFYGGYSMDDAFRYIATFFGAEVTGYIQPRDIASNALRNKRALLVLDGTDEIRDLNKIIEIRDRCAILIVTRYQDNVYGKMIFLDALPLDIAIQTLSAWSEHYLSQSDFQVWGNSQETNTVLGGEICDLLGRLPLALRLAGCYMSSAVHATELLSLLKSTPLIVLHQNERQHESVPILLDYIVQEAITTLQSQDPRKALAIIGLGSYESFHSDVIAHTLQLSPLEAISLLRTLIKYNLLRRTPDGRYQVLHRLVHTYAEHRLTPPTTALVRLAMFYDRLIEEQNKNGPLGYTRLDMERTHITAILSHCLEQKEWSWARSIVLGIYNYFRARGYWSELVELLESGLKVAQALNDKQMEGSLCVLLALHCLALESVEQSNAFSRHAQALASEDGNRSLEVDCLVLQGVTKLCTNRIDDSITLFEKALRTTVELVDRSRECSLLTLLGIAYARLGGASGPQEYVVEQVDELQKQIDPFKYLDEFVASQEARLEVYRESEFPSELIYGLEVAQYYEIFNASYEKMHPKRDGELLARAGEYLFEALLIAETIGDRSQKVICLTVCAELCFCEKNTVIAVRVYEEALKLVHDVDDRVLESQLLFGLALAYLVRGESEKVVECFERIRFLMVSINEFSREFVLAEAQRLCFPHRHTILDTIENLTPQLCSICKPISRNPEMIDTRNIFSVPKWLQKLRDTVIPDLWRQST